MKLKDIFKDDRAYISLKNKSAQFTARTTQERKTIGRVVKQFTSFKKWRLVKTGTRGAIKWWKLKRIKW